MISTRAWKVGLNTIILTFLAVTWAKPQAETEPKKVNFCDVVASPADYNGKTITVEVILSPSEHALFLYAAPCVSKERYDDTTQAVLPKGWESLRYGKKLRTILKDGRPAKVVLIGIFESGDRRYGPDGAARFRFSISQINSVQDVPKPKTR